MTVRLFTPDGPAVTPAERRQRLAEIRDAQQQLCLSEEAAIEDGAAFVDAAAPFGVWFGEPDRPTLAEWKAERR